MSIDLVEGWTGPLVYVLKVDGVAQDLTDMTVTLIARDAHDELLSLKGTLAVTDAESGEVTFSPASGDIRLRTSPMRVRWKVVDENTKVVFFPNANPEDWVIRP